MRSFWLAIKIGTMFFVVMAIVMTATISLFSHVAGHPVLYGLGLLRAHQGIVIAEKIEPLLADHDLDHPAVRELVRAAPRWPGGRSRRGL